MCAALGISCSGGARTARGSAHAPRQLRGRGPRPALTRDA